MADIQANSITGTIAKRGDLNIRSDKMPDYWLKQTT